MKSWEHTQNLPSDVKAWAEDVSGYLIGIYQDATEEEADITLDFYEQEKERLLDEVAINWEIEGSERTVIGLGMTWGGEPIFEDRRRVVLKFQPSAASSRSRNPKAANREAIETYDEICNRGDEDLVSPFFEASGDATWIAQQYALPVDPPLSGDNPPADWIRDSPVQSIRDRFEDVCEQRGLSVNTSRGNVGVTREGEPVLLDVGGHTEYQDGDS